MNNAIVLAGGRSARMGRDKAALPIGGGTLLDRVIAELRRVFSPIVVVGGVARDQPTLIDPAARDLVLIRDDSAFQGPVSALRRGLEAAADEYAFAAACDLPMLRAEVAAALCAMLGDREAVIPRVGGRLQMLHAVYRRGRCLVALGAMEAAGEHALHRIIDRIDARIVEEAELRSIDPELASFLNLNTPDDYRRLSAAIARG